MPVISWNFLDHDFIKWWLSSGDHRQVLTYFRELRAAIEPQACALAAMNAGKDQKQSLSFLLKEMTLLSAHFERDKWIAVDHRFHHLIYRACGNPFFSSFANLFDFVYHNFLNPSPPIRLLRLISTRRLWMPLSTGTENAPVRHVRCC